MPQHDSHGNGIALPKGPLKLSFDNYLKNPLDDLAFSFHISLPSSQPRPHVANLVPGDEVGLIKLSSLVSKT